MRCDWIGIWRRYWLGILSESIITNLLNVAWDHARGLVKGISTTHGKLVTF